MPNHIWLEKSVQKHAVDGGLDGYTQYHRHVIKHNNPDNSNSLCECLCHDPVNWKPTP